MTTAPVVRRAERRDLEAIVRIYNWAIVNTVSTFDIDPVTVADREPWFDRFDQVHPLLVAEVGGQIGGFAYYFAYRPKPAYHRTKETSVYVDPGWHGRGLGSALYTALIEHAVQRRVHTLVAVISGDNPGSVALHERFGFERVGCLRETGDKHGQFVDTAFYQRILDGS